jgi:hypothetical protein
MGLDIWKDIEDMGILGSQESHDLKAKIGQYKAAVEKGQSQVCHDLLLDIAMGLIARHNTIMAAVGQRMADLQAVVDKQARLIRKHETYEKILEAKSER